MKSYFYSLCIIGFVLLSGCAKDPRLQQVLTGYAEYEDCKLQKGPNAPCAKELNAWIHAENEAKAKGVNSSTIRSAIMEQRK